MFAPYITQHSYARQQTEINISEALLQQSMNSFVYFPKEFIVKQSITDIQVVCFILIYGPILAGSEQGMNYKINRSSFQTSCSILQQATCDNILSGD